MPQELYQAHAQWANRPADERFASLEDLLAFTQRQKQNSQESVRQLSDIKLGYSHDNELTMNGSGEFAYFSNWAFGQACRMIGAPASYLRTLPVDMARNCLQYGLERSNEKSLVLTRSSNSANSDADKRCVSAFTSDSYGRIWDASVAEGLIGAVEGTSWRVPPARSNNGSNNSGLYASDHDMFAFLVNDENPVDVGNAKLGRGFFCWNSETGAATFGLTTFLYNYVCGNHIVWGAEDVRELTIIHRTHAPERFYGAAIPYLNKFVENRSLDDRIRSVADKAMNYQIGPDLNRVQDWFKNLPFTKKEVTSAWLTGIDQGEDVKTLWGMVQGLTAYARDLEFADKRVNIERRAGALLEKAS
jgi:hypothetical protein